MLYTLQQHSIHLDTRCLRLVECDDINNISLRCPDCIIKFVQSYNHLIHKTETCDIGSTNTLLNFVFLKKYVYIHHTGRYPLLIEHKVLYYALFNTRTRCQNPEFLKFYPRILQWESCVVSLYRLAIPTHQPPGKGAKLFLPTKRVRLLCRALYMNLSARVER